MRYCFYAARPRYPLHGFGKVCSLVKVHRPRGGLPCAFPEFTGRGGGGGANSRPDAFKAVESADSDGERACQGVVSSPKACLIPAPRITAGEPVPACPGGVP